MSEADRTAEFFEAFYAGADDDYAQIPWARLSPRPVLVDWLDADPPAVGTPALVVACGLGDDAEELARRGCAVDAFDVSAPGGRLFVRSAVRSEDEPAPSRPWPLKLFELH